MFLSFDFEVGWVKNNYIAIISATNRWQNDNTVNTLIANQRSQPTVGVTLVLATLKVWFYDSS